MRFNLKAIAGMAGLLLACSIACKKPKPPIPTPPPEPPPVVKQEPPPPPPPVDTTPKLTEWDKLLKSWNEAVAKKDVYFEFDKSLIRDEDRAILTAIAKFMKDNPAAKLEIEGHCDERGTIEYNIGLGNRRASAALRYLVTLGVEEARFSTISFGKEKPVCTEANESCWWRNRRAHFELKR